MGSHVFTARGVRTAAGITGNAVQVTDGVITGIGDAGSLTGLGPSRDFGNAYIVPGLRDAHMHPVGYAAALRSATLAAARDFDDIVARLSEAAASRPPRSIMGMRLNEETLTERQLPTKDVLDRAVPDRPAIVHRYCGHVAVVNSAALHKAGITAATADPEGGTIDRDEAGEPTGVLRETAIELVSGSLGRGNEINAEELIDALHRLAAVGITSIGAILRTGAGVWASLGNELEIAVAAADRSPIKIGAYTIEEEPATVADSKRRIDAVGHRLRWLGIKRFGDGSFGGHTAAMHRPYVDVATTGTLRLTGRDEEITAASLANGGGAAIHAIGDRACGAVVDMFGRLIASGADRSKLRIEHASVLTDDDMARLAGYGITAVVQPPFLGSEAEWLPARLGADRIALTYRFRAMETAGIVLAGSSDCPVESPDPWAGMALAQDRAGMAMAERLTADRALAMYTVGAAIALGEPEPLAVGSPADFIVADRDPVAVSPTDLRDTKVLAVFIDGEEAAIDLSRPLWLD